MGKKRKYEDMDQDKLIKKIQKLQNKLKEKQNKGDLSPRDSLPSPHRPDDVDVTSNYDHDSLYMPPSQWAGSISPVPELLLPQEQHNQEDEIPYDLFWSPQPGPSAVPQASATVTSATVEQLHCPSQNILNETILNILGDAPKPETPFGNNIHKDVAARWQQILDKGMPKETKEKLISEYLIPANCDLLVPPMLNPEAKAALPETLVKRDYSLLNKQKQISAALAALAQVTDMLISNQYTTEGLLRPLSDASRLLCDSHNTETKTRRSFVIASINSDLKGALVDTTRDKFLFGENLTEKLNAAKSIQKSGDSLKSQNHYKQLNRNNFNNRNKVKGKLNTRALHPRQVASRFDAGQFRSAAMRYPAPRTQAPPPPRRARSPPPPAPPPAPPYKTQQPYRR